MTTHGNSGAVYIAANAVAEVTAWSFSANTDLSDDSALGDSVRTYKGSGIKDGSGSISCHWDANDANGQELMDVGASVELHVYPEGNTTGNEEYTGTVTIESIERSGDIGSIVSASFAFKGALTQVTVGP